MNDCIFCKIVNRQVPAKILYESAKVMAFADVDPQADVHILVAPKVHVSSLTELHDRDLLFQLVAAVQKLIGDRGLEKKYKVMINGGSLQHVPHLHWHLLAGNFKQENG